MPCGQRGSVAPTKAPAQVLVESFQLQPECGWAVTFDGSAVEALLERNDFDEHQLRPPRRERRMEIGNQVEVERVPDFVRLVCIDDRILAEPGTEAGGVVVRLERP